MTRTSPCISAARGSRSTRPAIATRSSGRSVPAISRSASASPSCQSHHRPERLIEKPRMTLIRIGHSPDADDAFMFYALTAGKVRIPGAEIEHTLEDIESLNRRARTAELEVTAVSAATYVLVADRYRLMDP